MRRSRANPFKSTQLRQWGFICYLGGHIVSRRERTDRLRRASDGAGPREPGAPIPTRRRLLQENDFIPSLPPSPPPPFAHPFHRFPPFILRPPPSSSSTSLPSARKADSPLHVRVEISLGLPIPLPLSFQPLPSVSHLLVLLIFLSFPEILRWKNMAFCLPFFYAIAKVKRERNIAWKIY